AGRSGRSAPLCLLGLLYDAFSMGTVRASSGRRRRVLRCVVQGMSLAPRRRDSDNAIARGGKMKAREIMTPNVECVTRQDSLSRAAQIMRDADVGAVPVVEDRSSMRLVGVITDRDIA